MREVRTGLLLACGSEDVLMAGLQGETEIMAAITVFIVMMIAFWIREAIWPGKY